MRADRHWGGEGVGGGQKQDYLCEGFVRLMIWVCLDLSLDREAILNSPSKRARIELEQRVGPNVLRKLGGVNFLSFNLLRLAGS